MWTGNWLSVLAEMLCEDRRENSVSEDIRVNTLQRELACSLYPSTWLEHETSFWLEEVPNSDIGVH